MENRIAVISIIITDRSASEEVNKLLSEYGEYVLGRMGIPYKERKVCIISCAVDAPLEIINALTGKLGKIQNVSVKALFGKI